MHPILFEIFGRQIAAYGTCVVLGAAAAWGLIRLLRGRDESVFYAYLMCVCGAMAGAFLLRPITRIPELIINWSDFSGASIGVVMGFLFGELVFYGGLIGGAVGLLLYCRGVGLSVAPMADLFAPAVALGHAFGRVGCYLGGCCYGVHVEDSHPFGVRFPPETAGGAPIGEPLLATQLIEAACLLLLAAVLVIAYRMTLLKGVAGFVACLYGTLYALLRFVLEFYRGDLVRGVYGPFSTSQYISIAIFCVCAWFLGRFFLTLYCSKYRIS